VDKAQGIIFFSAGAEAPNLIFAPAIPHFCDLCSSDYRQPFFSLSAAYNMTGMLS